MNSIQSFPAKPRFLLAERVRQLAALSKVAAIVIPLLLLTGCVAGGAAGAFTQPPTIGGFTAFPQTISKGQSTTISWTVTGATGMSIDSTSGSITSMPVSGASVSVSPTVTTTYTLTASNPAGKNTATLTVSVVDQLQIKSFTANPTLIAQGQNSTLSWDVTGAVQLSIEPTVGDVTGSTSVNVTPPVTTDYDLIAIDGTGTRFDKHATVTVVSPPTITSFLADPPQISSGQRSTLKWNVVGTTTSLTIDNGVGDVTGKTSVSVSPTATTTYTLTATDTQGSITATSTKQTTVTFSSSFIPTLSSFKPSAASVDPGHGVALTAVFDAGPGGTATIDHGVGTISSGVPVSTGGLTSSVTFTVTIANGSNSVTGQERIIDGSISDFAGTGVAGSTDGPGSSATFNSPLGLAADGSGNTYVAEGSTTGGTANHTIRKITPGADVSTLAGTAGQAGSDDGTGAAARFNNPHGVAVDASSNLYVADTDNSTIRKITPAGEVSTFAGSAGEAGSADGTGSAARFNHPTGVAVGPSGNIYVADSSNHNIRQITPAGVVTTLAGSQQGFADGTGAAAKFNFPNGVGVDADENIYVADFNNHRIRMVTSAGVVTTLAGSGARGSTDGTGTAATFNFPTCLTLGLDPASSQKYIFVADSASQRIRRITSAGVVETIVGGPGTPNSDPAGPLPGIIQQPYGITLDSSRGKLFISLPGVERIIATPF
jgi:sugar lactone lactonase YvrE